MLNILVDLGKACTEYQDKVFVDLPCNQIQCDEIWAFCYAKEKNVPEDKKGHFGYGDVWAFTAICAESKLVPTWHIGRRDVENATLFMRDLADRMAKRVQLTTDGHRMYLEAVEDAFGSEVDYSQLVQIYGTSPEAEKRYSPAQCNDEEKHRISGNPDSENVSTSY